MIGQLQKTRQSLDPSKLEKYLLFGAKQDIMLTAIRWRYDALADCPERSCDERTDHD
jgi:hypothetical protein